MIVLQILGGLLVASVLGAAVWLTIMALVTFREMK